MGSIHINWCRKLQSYRSAYFSDANKAILDTAKLEPNTHAHTGTVSTGTAQQTTGNKSCARLTNRGREHREGASCRVRELAVVAELARGLRAVCAAKPPVGQRWREGDIGSRERAAAGVGVVIGKLVPCDSGGSFLQPPPHPPRPPPTPRPYSSLLHRLNSMRATLGGVAVQSLHSKWRQKQT
jgi:hypothetical protein